MTSRINWAIQSSGVDYLHLLIIAMDYLIRRFNIDARLAITVHDEIRYLVREDDKYKAAMALQVSNLWTRAMFSQQMGINDLPQACAYFSAVDIDHVLRKEVDMDCVTPSHSEKIPHGESLNIADLLGMGSASLLDSSVVPTNPPRLDNIPYAPRQPVMKALEAESDISFLKAQITADDNELRDILRDHRKLAGREDEPEKLSATARKVLPYQAYPELMEEPIDLSAVIDRDFQNGFEEGKHRNWWWQRQMTNRQRSASRF